MTPGEVVAKTVGAEEISYSAVRRYVEAHEMEWPLYSDADAARAHGHDTVIAPWSMLLTAAMPAYWAPGEEPLKPGTLPPFMWTKLDLPGSEMVTTSVDLEFLEPLRIGDRIETTYRIVRETPKTTRVGEGVYVDFELEFRRQDGTVVAVERTSIYSYTPSAPSPSASSPPPVPATSSAPPGPVGSASSPHAGDLVGPLSMHLSLQRLVMVSGANRDFAPTHIDNEAAREGGAPAAYADIMFIFTMIDRLLLEWAGPSAVLRRIGPVKLHDFVLSGEDLAVTGTVRDVAEATASDGRAGTEVEVEIAFTQGARRPVTGRGRVWTPA
ncbi:FAS1-like dehydratase domain-containing protein [Phytohabitans kaempferiae]|uniref:MaoC family dehydratase N-terminal domain-containing protein n=1 Tax=Phytohabitans kaempferiae TaxID=1620943 RepID=A0ABV6M933_9ACTN